MMIPGGECRCGPSEDDVSFLMENSSCGGRCQEENQFLVPAEANLELDVHKRNLSTVASPVILLFDGFHNLVYHFYLATRSGNKLLFDQIKQRAMQVPPLHGSSSDENCGNRDFKTSRQKIFR